MNAVPGTHDAELILRLYELRREPRMREARRWFASQFSATTTAEFDAQCPRGSEENASFRMVVGYWEMAASFITAGVLNRELFFQSGQELLFAWEKVRRLLPALRERSKNPLYFRHFEEVGTGYVDWLQARVPEFYEQYSQSIQALTVPREEGR